MADDCGGLSGGASANNHCYLLVVRTGLLGLMPFPLTDQTAEQITGELIKLFSIYGHPEYHTLRPRLELRELYPSSGLGNVWCQKIPHKGKPTTGGWNG